MLHLSVLVKIPKRLSVIRLLGLADVRGENLNTLCRLGKKIHGWPPVNLHMKKKPIWRGRTVAFMRRRRKCAQVRKRGATADEKDDY